jgi:CRP-like cAMP-binding protein
MEFNQRILSNIVREVPFFIGLSVAHAEKILNICEPLNLTAGDVLISEGVYGHEMYLLLSGSLQVVIRKHNTVLAKVNPVGVIGEIGLLLDKPRSATVIAIETCYLLKLAKNKLTILFNDEPQIELQLYRNLCNILCEKVVKNNIRLEEYNMYRYPRVE